MAFEASLSRMHIVPLGQESAVDIRHARLPKDLDENDDYDPLDHRKPKIVLSNRMAFLNLIRLGFGAGVLSLPLATSQAGIICGPFMNLSSGLILIHTHLLLLRCLHEVCRQMKIPYISYRYGFRLAILRGPPVLKWLGNSGPKCIAFFMILSQLALSTVCVIFTSDSLRDMMDWSSHKPATLVLFFPYLFLQYYMKNLRIISYISMAGNILNFLGVSLVFYQIFRNPHGELIAFETHALPLLFAFGIYIFNMSVVGLVLTLDKVILNPRDLTKRYGIIEMGLIFPCVFGTIFGALGYWSFGPMDENILRALPFDNTLSMVAIGFHLIAIAFAYPINIFPAISIILDIIKIHCLSDEDQNEDMMQNLDRIVRPCCVVISFLICFFMPFQGPFVAMVGNLCTSVLLLIFPALMEICLKYPNDYGVYNFYLIKNLALIIIGLISATFGAIMCSYLIYVRILYASNPREGILL